jgi:hypothetical protein
MTLKHVPDIPMFWQNTAAVIHDLPAINLSSVDERNHVPIPALTHAGALDRAMQLAVVERLIAIGVGAAHDAR